MWSSTRCLSAVKVRGWRSMMQRVPRGRWSGKSSRGLVAFGRVQGLRAAAPCLTCKERYDDQPVIRWDPVKRRLG